MVTFAMSLVRLAKAFFHGSKDPEFRALAFTALVLMLSGTVFYSNVEGWSYLDSLYFSVATLTTVGYGDFTPVTSFGKVFTIFYILGGVGLILGFLNQVGDKSRA